jgi:hypothetical protein
MRPPTLTITARGPAAFVLLALFVFALFGLPRMLASPLPADEAADVIRLLRSRRVSETYGPRLSAASPADKPAVAEEMARALRSINEPLGELRIRRAWIGPPFAYRWTHVVEVRRDGEPPSTYRISRGIASEAPRFFWHLPLF